MKKGLLTLTLLLSITSTTLANWDFYIKWEKGNRTHYRAKYSSSHMEPYDLGNNKWEITGYAFPDSKINKAREDYGLLMDQIRNDGQEDKLIEYKETKNPQAGGIFLHLYIRCKDISHH